MARNKVPGLKEIGVEGFADIEDGDGRKRQPQYGYWSHQSHAKRRNSNYNYVPPTKDGAIDCNEAVKLYGGVLVKETGRKKKSFFGFGSFKAK